MKEKTLGECINSLSKAGFESFYCQGTRACFDVVARRERELYILKVLENIDGLTQSQASELQKIAYMFGARALVVGEHTKTEKLAEGVLYERLGIPCLSPRAFSRMIECGELPGARKLNVLTINVDGKALARARGKAGLSLEELSKKTGVSKDTIYRYEHERVKGTENNIKKIEEVLRASIRKELDPFSEQLGVVDEKTALSFVGFESVRTHSAPFQVIGKKKESLLAGENSDRRTMKKRAVIYKSIDEVMHSSSCFLVEQSATDSISGVPVVRRSELDEIKRPKKLLKLLEERSE